MKVRGLPAAVPRWLDSGSDASPEIRAALSELAADVDDTERLMRLEMRFAPLFGVPSGVAHPLDSASGASSSAPSVAAGSSIVGKLGVFIVVGGALAVGVSSLGAERTEPSAPVSMAQTAAPRRVVVEPWPAEIPKADVPSDVAGARDEALEAARRPLLAPAVAAESRRSARAAAPPARATPPRVPVESLAEEARLLRDAREQLAVSPERALSALGAHALRFPRSTLAEEREFFIIEALVQNGETRAARERVEAFGATKPSSPYLERARRLVGGVRDTR